MEMFLISLMEERYYREVTIQTSLNNAIKRFPRELWVPEFDFGIEEKYKAIFSPELTVNKTAIMTAKILSSRYLFPKDISTEIIKLYHSGTVLKTNYDKTSQDIVRITNWIESEIRKTSSRFGNIIDEDERKYFELCQINLSNKIRHECNLQPSKELNESFKQLMKINKLILKGIEIHR